MDIQPMQIDKIKAAKYNPRKDLKPGDPEFEKLKASVERWDLVEPLVVNKRTGVLVSGHQRLKVCKALGMKTVEAVVVDLPSDREKLLNISLNKVCGDWDYLKLEELFKQFEAAKLNITGFDEDEIKRIANLVADAAESVLREESKPQPEQARPASEDDVEDDAAPTSAGGQAGDDDTDDDKFIVYVSFANKKNAENWLEQENINAEFKGSNIVTVHMGDAANGD